jgi:D-3-phosphoglycerate dehydrogenase
MNVALAIAEQMAVFLMKGEVRNAVNMPSLTAEMRAAVGPYLTLGEKLGSYYGQLADQLPKEIEIVYSGHIAELDFRPITTAVLKGLLTPNMDTPVNYVNAPAIAKERGIKIVESKATGTKDFASMITIKIVTKDKEQTIGGALFGTQNLRIVRINDFYLEVVPEGEILVIHNSDKPGVVGNVGHTLATHNINISRMQLALDSKKKEALILANIDSRASDAAITALSKVPNVISVKSVSL